MDKNNTLIKCTLSIIEKRSMQADMVRCRTRQPVTLENESFCVFCAVSLKIFLCTACIQ